MEEVPRRTSLVPLRSLVCTLFNKGGSRRALRLPGAGGDHFHCTVDPSRGHIRCRFQKFDVIFSYVPFLLSICLENKAFQKRRFSQETAEKIAGARRKPQIGVFVP